MFQLIILVVTIGLIAAVTATTLSYLPMDAQLRQQMHKDADRGIKALECAVTRYLDAHRDTDPQSPTYNKIIDPIVGQDMVPLVTPSYGFLPANVRKEMSWAITGGQVSGMPAVAICLRPVGATNAMEQDVISKLQEQLPVGSAYINNGCNATSNVTGGGYLTYWIPTAHVQ